MALYYGKFEPGTMRNSSRLGYGEFLYVKIADEICNYVEQKKLNNGDKIPSERELSTMLSVSRNSVREAIRELESRGILKVHPGKGAFLVGNVEDRAILIQMKKKDFFELFEIKTVLEPAQASARRVSSPQPDARSRGWGLIREYPGFSGCFPILAWISQRWRSVSEHLLLYPRCGL